MNAMRSRLRKHFGLKQESASTREVELLDTVEGSVLKARLLLIRENEVLSLYALDTSIDFGQPVAKSSMRDGRFFLQDIEDDDLRRKLAPYLDARAVFAFSKARLVEHRIAIRNNDRKTVVRWKTLAVEILRKGESSSLGCVCSLESVRGYEAEFAQAVELLECDESGSEGLRSIAQGLWDCRETIVYGFGTKIRVSLDAADTCGSEMTVMIADLLQLARSNERGIIDDIDTEFLHDYRVCIRKIRSLLSFLRGVYGENDTEKLKARFSALGGRTNRLRDLDVYLLRRGSYMERLPESLKSGLSKMFDGIEKERKKEHRAISRYFQTKAYEKEISSLLDLFRETKSIDSGERFDARVGSEVRNIVLKRYRKVNRIGSKIDSEMPGERIHGLRIHCKKLRYAMELFASIFQESIQHLVKRLKKLQTVLGDYNDCSVQQENLMAILNDADRNESEMMASIGGLISVLNIKQQECRSHVKEYFDELNSEDTKALVKSVFGEEAGS